MAPAIAGADLRFEPISARRSRLIFSISNFCDFWRKRVNEFTKMEGLINWALGNEFLVKIIFLFLKLIIQSMKKLQ